MNQASPCWSWPEAACAMTPSDVRCALRMALGPPTAADEDAGLGGLPPPVAVLVRGGTPRGQGLPPTAPRVPEILRGRPWTPSTSAFRLSAEGVAEVVAALKKVQVESEKAAAKPSRGFLGLEPDRRARPPRCSNTLGTVATLGVHKFRRWIDASVDAASQGREVPGRRRGPRPRASQRCTWSPEPAASSLEDLGRRWLARTGPSHQAAEGSPRAIAVLRDLGLTLKDFRGKDAVQAFDLLAQRITALPSPVQRTKAALDIFRALGGKPHPPTMNTLAEEGLAHVIDRARELGVLIDTRLAGLFTAR